MNRRMSRAVVVTCALVLLGAILPASAAALTATTPVAIRYSTCHRNLAWRGSLFYIWGTSSQNKGTVDHCYFIEQVGTVDSAGKVQDGDSTADYYIVDQSVEWKVSYSNGGYSTDNYGKLAASSSIAAISGVYAASPYTVTSSSCWSSPLSVGVGFGPFTIRVSPVLCDGGTLRRDSYGSTSAQWSSDNVIKTPYWETAYMVKVAQNAKPTFTGKLYYPTYTGYKDGGKYCGGGYCVDTWAYSKTWATDTMTVKAP